MGEAVEPAVAGEEVATEPAKTDPLPVANAIPGLDDSGSELSELEDDDEMDIGDIEPDHYYEGGKIPVFKPVSHLNLSQFLHSVFCVIGIN